MTHNLPIKSRDFYTIDELSEKADLHYSTIYYAILTRRLKSYKVPLRAQIRIKKTEAARWLRER